MARQPIFSGLVFDETGNPVQTTFVGDEPCYVVNDAGFLRHIPSEQVDRHVFQAIEEMINGHEAIISDQTAKMLGQDDIFSRAFIASQLKDMEKQYEKLSEIGIPDEARAYLGMMGFRIIINVHGDIIAIDQPGVIDSEGE